MNISVKAVKTFRGHDGHGWECTLYVDGKKVGYAVDDGWGGDLQLDVPTPTINAMADYVKTLPKYKSDGKGGVPSGWECKMNLEIVIGDLVNVVLNQKHAKGILGRRLVISKDGTADTMVSWAKKQRGTDHTQGIRALIKTDYPSAVILNDLPIADATPYLVS